MVPLLAAGLGLQGLGTVASLIGSWSSNKKAREAQEAYQREANKRYYTDKAELESWRYKNAGNYMDTAEAQSVITQMNENARQANDNIASNSAMTGASNAAITAQKKASQGNIAEMLRRLAGQGTQWRNMLDSQYMNQNRQISQQKGVMDYQTMQMDMANEQNKTAQWGNFMQSLGSMGNTLMTAYGAGAFETDPASKISGKKGWDWVNNTTTKRN